MFLPRSLSILTALLTLLLFAAAPAGAEPLPRADAAYGVADGPHQASKPVDHASKRLRHTASLEEFFEIDDDAEQDFKPQPLLVHAVLGAPRAGVLPAHCYRAAAPTHRVCASYATGPPHA